jgi:hypothetical protein
MPAFPPVTMKTFPERSEILSVVHSGAGEELTENCTKGRHCEVWEGEDGGTLGGLGLNIRRLAYAANQLELVKGEWNMLMGELNPISDSILALTALAHLRPSHPIPVDGCVASRR